MSRYIVQIKGPAGYETYLSHGREVRRENAMRYPHPSSAKRAGRSYEGRSKVWPADVFWYVIDTRTEERLT